MSQIINTYLIEKNPVEFKHGNKIIFDNIPSEFMSVNVVNSSLFSSFIPIQMYFKYCIIIL